MSRNFSDRSTSAVSTLPIILLSVLLLSAVGLSCSTDEKPAAPPSVGNVALETVKESALPELYEAVGTVRSSTVSRISARMMGAVTAVHVREGDLVRSGQPLLEIERRDVAAQLAAASAGLEEVDRALSGARAARSAAEANRKLADRTFARYQALSEKNSISPQEFDQVEASHAAAVAGERQAVEGEAQVVARRRQVLAQIEGARTALAHSRIDSPIDGIVTARFVDPGSQAAPGMPLFTVEDPASYRVEAALEEGRSGAVDPGETVSVRLGDDKVIPGKVSSVVPAVDSGSRTFVVKVALPRDKAPLLRSGMFATVEFPVGTRSGITIPSSALMRKGDLNSVYVVDEKGIAHLRLVTTGRREGERVEVLSGLSAGERIAAGDGLDRLVDGARVVTPGPAPEERS